MRAYGRPVRERETAAETTPARAPDPAPSPRTPAGAIALQRAAGNRAATRVLARTTEAERMDELMMSVQHQRDEGVSSMRNHLIDLYEALARQAPEAYTGNLYNQVLPGSTTQSNYTAAAGYTARDPVNNRTRWALQHTLLLYALRHGHGTAVSRAENSTEFSYQIHRVSFAFANDVATIRHFPWMLLTVVDVPAVGDYLGAVYYQPDAFLAGLDAVARTGVTDPRAATRAFVAAYSRTLDRRHHVGGEIINWTIETTNSPHGPSAMPWYGVGLRAVLDEFSRMTQFFYD